MAYKISSKISFGKLFHSLLLFANIWPTFFDLTAASVNNQQVPSAPRSVDVSQINSSSIKVSWEPPPNDDVEIIGYYVYKDRLLNGQIASNNLRKAVAIVDKKKLYAYINDLEPNSEYAIRVAAFNMRGDGEHSAIKKIVTGGRPPSPPRTQSISLLSEDRPIRARIEWLPPRHTYGLPLTKYVLWWKPLGFDKFQRVEVGPMEQSFVLVNLLSGHEYELHITAVNEIGASENATEQLITPTRTPDGEPQNIRYTIFKNHLSFIWDPPQLANRNGNITHYEVVFKPLAQNGHVIQRNVSSHTAVFDIDPSQSYIFKVAAATSKGLGVFSRPLQIDASQGSAIGPPRNVRVQAITNTSVVVQWEFLESSQPGSGGMADGFNVKFMHEPSSRISNAVDKWRQQTVMDPKARHLEITRLTTNKPYAFCVLAIKQNRLGPCSDPPVTIDEIRPTFVVQNLQLRYKTSQSVDFEWDYPGESANIGFYIKQMGQKTYLDQYLEEKSLVSPGFEKRLDGTERRLLWPNLRPYMNYTFQVGVYSLETGRLYWPRELSVQTDPMGPPFVDRPKFIQSDTPTTVQIQLSCATEEYGPISHYWIIVVPGNYSKDHMTNLDSLQLQRSTNRFKSLKTAHLSKVSISSTVRNRTAGYRRSLFSDGAMQNQRPQLMTNARRLHRREETRSLGIGLGNGQQFELNGIYIAAQIPSYHMQRLFREEKTFTLGDSQEYEGYLNFPLDPDVPHYKLLTRAFAKHDDARRSDQPFDHRPPMQEPASKFYTDSLLTDSFSTRSSSSLLSGPMSRSGGGNLWIVGPVIAILIILLIVGMLVIWRLRCNRRKSIRAGGGPGGVTKVARTSRELPGGANKLSNGNTLSNTGGIPTETSKLLLGMDTDGRPVMNAYERPAEIDQKDAYTESAANALSLSNQNLYGMHNPIMQQHSATTIYGGAGGLSSGSAGAGGDRMSASMINSQQQHVPPIPLSEFATHIDRLKMNNNAMFIQEFESIEHGQHFTWENSSMDVNKHKNRYANVVAYDHSRVILTPEEGDEDVPGSDYINANYIDGYEKTKAYIATQGPLPETFADFWHMVWECNAQTIVMLTRLEERSRTKCDQYWPTKGQSMYGNYRVTLLDTVELAHYSIRTFRLEHTKKRGKPPRDIHHAQFTAWPDHGVPTHPTPFLMFLKRVKALNPVGSPLVTHCSAGIGRTGAFIVIDCMLDRLRYETTVDIYGCVRSIRAQRSYMVQTDDQYIFIHDAVLDAAQSGSTEVPSSKLFQHVQALSHPQRQMPDNDSGMDIEFKTLVTLKAPNVRCMAANAVVNANKNQNMITVPWDYNRVELPRVTGLEGSDYVNASWVDGYRSRNAYIATQAPLPNTMNDFWRMLWAHDCSIIVMLVKLTERCIEYWPNERRENYGGLVVDCVSEFDMTSYVLREFKVTDNQTGHSKVIRQFQFMDWPERGGVPAMADKFVDFIQQVHQTKIQFGYTGPICVHCYDGAGRTGVFIACSTVIDRIKLEHVVDIFTAVKLLRMQRPNLVELREEYEFCYKAAIQFLASYEDSQYT